MRKKLIGLVGIVVTILAVTKPCNVVYAADYSTVDVSRIGHVVVEAPVYATPSYEDTILVAIPSGAPINVTGITNNGWYRVELEKKMYYVPQGFLNVDNVNIDEGSAKQVSSNYISPDYKEQIEYKVNTYDEGVAALNDALRRHASVITLKTTDYGTQMKLYSYLKDLLRSNDAKTYAQGNMFGYRTSSSGVYQGNKFNGTLISYITYGDSFAEELFTENTVATLCKNLQKNGSSYNTIKAVHDFICNNADYDWSYLRNNEGYVYGSAYDCLANHLSVCSGYALLFQKFMEQMNIPSYYVADDVHAWNIVYVDGNWYQIDCTWDGEYNTTKYDYFLFGTDAEHAYQASIPVSAIRHP